LLESDFDNIHDKQHGYVMPHLSAIMNLYKYKDAGEIHRTVLLTHFKVICAVTVREKIGTS